MADMRELGSTGLLRDGGVIREEYLRELSGDRWFRIVREMVDDPIVGATLFAIEMMLRQVSWEVKPVKGDESTAQFVQECLGDMSFTWADTLGEILTMLPYGFSFLEIVYKVRGGDVDNPMYKSQYDDGKIGWRKWSARSQETIDEWDFDDTGGIQGAWQRIEYAMDRTYIPIDKSLLFRTSTRKNNPQGRSVLRSAYRPYYQMRMIENVEGIGIERDLAGLPVAWVPPQLLGSSPSADEAAALAAIKDIVVNIRRDEQEGIIFPQAYDANGNKLYDLTLLSSGGQRQFETGTIIARYAQRIAMSVMADFLLIGHEKQGSFALSKDKSAMFTTALRSWLDSICEVINRFAIPRLLKVNPGMSTKTPPMLVHGDVGRIDLEELGSYIVRLSSAGFQLNLDADLEAYLRQQGNLPLQSEDAKEAIRKAAGSAMAPVAPGDTPTSPATTAVQEGVVGRRQQIAQANSERFDESIVTAAARIIARGE